MWLEYDLFQVSDFSIGGTPSRNEPNYWSKKPDGTPWVAISDLKKKFLTETEEHVSDQGARNSNVKLVPKNTVLMSFKLSIGRVCITSSDVYTNEAIAAFYPRREKLDHRFLYHILPDSALSTVTDNAIKGATLNKQKIAKIKLRIPSSVEEQKKISDILDKADEAIEKTQAIIDKYENIKQGMMQDLFTRGVDENGQLRPSYENSPHLYQETELGWVPKDWEVVTLEDRIQKIEQGWSPDCEDIPADNGEWGVLKTTAVSWAGYQEAANKLLPKKLSPKPQYEVKDNDVLMTRAGPSDRVGVVAYVVKTQAKLMLSDKLYRIVPKASLKANYLSFSLSSEPVQKQIELLKTGMAESQSNISQDGIRKIRIAVPDTESEQLAVCKRLNSLVNKIISEQSNLLKVQSIKLGLMQDLLTGKVRVAKDVEERKEAVA